MKTLRDIGFDYFSDKLIRIIIQTLLKSYPQIKRINADYSGVIYMYFLQLSENLLRNLRESAEKCMDLK
ncbi:MAG: hypothetical protein A2W80_13260 [Candidatus Riflebacteria bacterium GWC2_50_8]|nr:MAG: hypothetical protein A2W80_13260 [Candidatus Riflebacteria bacterium GWC2_50_8]